MYNAFDFRWNIKQNEKPNIKIHRIIWNPWSLFKATSPNKRATTNNQTYPRTNHSIVPIPKILCHQTRQSINMKQSWPGECKAACLVEQVCSGFTARPRSDKRYNCFFSGDAPPSMFEAEGSITYMKLGKTCYRIRRERKCLLSRTFFFFQNYRRIALIEFM